jgi:hypothetical protein
MGGDGGEMMMMRGMRVAVGGGEMTTTEMRATDESGERTTEIGPVVGSGERMTEIGAAVGDGRRTTEGRAVGTPRTGGRAGARGMVTMMMTTIMMRIGDGGGAGERMMIQGNGGWSVHRLGGDV